MENLRENVKRAISAPNKAMPDEEGDKLISGEKQVEFQNLFNHLIQERLEKKTMLSGLLKTGENITAIQIKRYPR